MVEHGALRGAFAARDYLAAHLGQPVRLCDLARLVHVSPYHLQRVFAERFRETPLEFATRLRMDRAKHLLMAGNHSVTDVCFEVGYESLGTFSSRFREKTGLSPREFQREARRVFPGSGDHWKLYYVPACFWGTDA